MKINHNMSAIIANNQLLRNENALSESVERLSSGLRINHASDDAAGMAISTKMRAQIKGLDQASRNASDGISVLETADGAMNEVTSMLQRMRELSVQAANEIYQQEDLQAIQDEITSLTEEIDRVSSDTEFNTMKLLDGSLDRRVYTNTRSVSRIAISDAVTSNDYTIKVTQDATKANATGNTHLTPTDTDPIPAGTVMLNNQKVEITGEEDWQEVYEKLRNAGELANIDVADAGNKLSFEAEAYGSNAQLTITCDNADLEDFLGLTGMTVEAGKDAAISLDTGFTSQATYTSTGRDVVITDRGGFELSFRVEDAIPQNQAEATVNFEVTDIGTMTLQIGANENQQMEVRIPSVSAATLGIDDINVCKDGGADAAITLYDKALSKVNEARSRVGAYQNRLEYAVSSLDETEEDMTSALSRIEDTDMAEEMTTYTQYNVLSQAATSVLAQANDIPQQALQLLQ